MSPKIIYSLFFLFISIYINCHSTADLKYSVTFQVTVRAPAEAQQVFITGNQPELGNWNPGKIAMNPVNDSVFVKTISFKKGTHIEFKITEGNWWLEALGRNEQLYNNLNADVKSDTTVSVTVYDWKNTFSNGTLVFNKKRFFPQRESLVLDDLWKYHPGDNLNWAKEEINDSAWKSVNSDLDWTADTALTWQNIGWFRFHFIADTSMWNKSLAMRIGQLGASEIYYNGRHLYSFGKVGNSAAAFRPSRVRIWKEFRIDPRKKQVIAVRYANYNWKEQKRLGFSPGFTIYLKDINTILQVEKEKSRSAANHQMIFTLIPLILFVLHLFIYSFNPREKQNLFYAICLLGFAGITFFNFEKSVATNPAQIILFYKLNGISVPVAVFFGLLTSFAIQYYKMPRRWMIYLAAFILISMANFYDFSGGMQVINYIFIGIIFVDMFISSSSKGGKKNPEGGWIIFAGLLVLAISIVIQILLDFSIIPSLTDYNQVFVYGMLGFAVSMSLFLAYNFSLTNKNLEAQLIKVKELSEKTIEQERLAHKLELERRLIDAENQRKTKELEEARGLQLSLLPKEIPRSYNFDIAFYMKTATEVGGDYYDIISKSDGRLTIAIGDATGHGVKAGIMVAIVKGLIHELSPSLKPVQVLNKINEVIRTMKLGNLYMGLTLIKFNETYFCISSAGMPPALLYRRDSNRIEEITIKRMPLGATNRLKFEQQNVGIGPGDVLLLLSDGLSELFNDKKETFEIERIKENLIKNAGKTAREVIAELKAAAENWQNGAEQADDLTLVAVKCQENAKAENRSG